MAYVKAEKSILYSTKINNDEKIALLTLLDRLSLSQTKGSMFQKDGHFFVTYAQQSMASVLQKSERTVRKIYRHLESIGMIQRKKRFNASDLIFVTVAENSAGMDRKNMPTNKNNLNKTNYVSTTSNTINTENAKNEAHQNQPQKSLLSNSDKSEYNYIQNQQIALQNWLTAVKGKLRLHPHVIHAIRMVSHDDVNLCYQLTGLMTNAKKHIANKYHMGQSKRLKSFTRYESNENLGDKLAERIMYIASKLPQRVSEQAKYWTRSFVNFFGWALGMVDHTTTMVNPAIGDGTYMEQRMYDIEVNAAERAINGQLGIPDGPEIPMFKIR